MDTSMSIYESIYDLIFQFVYGGNLPASGEAVCTLLATVATCFLFAVPFIILYRFIKILVG